MISNKNAHHCGSSTVVAFSLNIFRNNKPNCIPLSKTKKRQRRDKYNGLM